MEKWRLIKLIVRNPNDSDSLSTDNDENNILGSLQKERERYKEKLNRAKETARLSNIIESLSEQEKKNKQLLEEVQNIEQPIIKEIKYSKPFHSLDEQAIRKRQGVAMLTVRRKRAEINRVTAKTTATIELLNSKLHTLNKNGSKQQTLKKVSTTKNPGRILATENEDEEREEEDSRSREKTVEEDTNPIEEINLNAGLVKLWKQRDSSIEKLKANSITTFQENGRNPIISFQETARQLRTELQGIEEKIMKVLHVIKTQQRYEIRVQKMRIKYREMVRELRDNDERIKLRFSKLQARYRRLEMEKDLNSLKINSRLSKRNFSYF